MATERTIKNPDGSVTVNLRFPFKAVVGDQPTAEITQITLPRPKGKHLSRASGAGTAYTLSLISALTGIAPPFLEEMDGVDVMTCGDVFSDFLEIGPKAGT